MSYKILYVLIEGDDEERFFETIIKPMFEKKYDSVKPWQYASKKDVNIKNFLRSIEAMQAESLGIG
jgi:hypothetical protein